MAHKTGKNTKSGEKNITLITEKVEFQEESTFEASWGENPRYPLQERRDFEILGFPANKCNSEMMNKLSPRYKKLWYFERASKQEQNVVRKQWKLRPFGGFLFWKMSFAMIVC